MSRSSSTSHCLMAQAAEEGRHIFIALPVDLIIRVLIRLPHRYFIDKICLAAILTASLSLLTDDACTGIFAAWWHQLADRRPACAGMIVCGRCLVPSGTPLCRLPSEIIGLQSLGLGATYSLVTRRKSGCTACGCSRPEALRCCTMAVRIQMTRTRRFLLRYRLPRRVEACCRLLLALMGL
jgi:hypothetical protein